MNPGEMASGCGISESRSGRLGCRERLGSSSHTKHLCMEPTLVGLLLNGSYLEGPQLFSILGCATGLHGDRQVTVESSWPVLPGILEVVISWIMTASSEARLVLPTSFRKGMLLAALQIPTGFMKTLRLLLLVESELSPVPGAAGASGL